MDSANTFCFVPRSEVEKEAYKEQVRQKVTANVVRISFDDVKSRSEQFIDDSPIYCASCQASLNLLSIVTCNDGITTWVCEFCSYSNQLNISYSELKLPTVSDQFYMLQRTKDQPLEKEVKQEMGMICEQQVDDEIDLEDKRTVIFCLDNSGSMINGTSFKNDKGESKYMSRKQCVEKALINQIAQMKKTQPNRKAGIVLFSKEVLVLGDCQSQSIAISKEGTFEKLLEQGQNCYAQTFNLPVGSILSKGESNEIAMKYKETRTNGTTALGPGLAVSLGLASQSEEPGAMIVLCTDGLANEGIGKLEDERDIRTYENMGQFAKSQGILIHTITMRGMESDVRVLGKLATETGGRTTRLGPSDFDKNFVELMKQDLVATQVEIVIQLHEGLTLIDGDPHTDVGNATSESKVTYQYAVKENYDFKNLKSIPLQVKIFLKTLKGDKMVRIITHSQNITTEKQIANKNIKIDILAGHAQKMNAQKIQYSSAFEAEIDYKNWNVFMEEEVFQYNDDQIESKNKYQSKKEKLSKAIKTKQTSEKLKEVVDILEEEDMEQDLFDCYY